jgi:hypothetical protein
VFGTWATSTPTERIHAVSNLVRGLRWCHGQFALLLEATSAQHRPALGGLERYRGFGPALGTRSPGLGANFLAATNALRLALLAALGIVRELFVVEKYLLAGCENKLGATINACEYSIREFHGRLP